MLNFQYQFMISKVYIMHCSSFPELLLESQNGCIFLGCCHLRIPYKIGKTEEFILFLNSEIQHGASQT